MIVLCVLCLFASCGKSEETGYDAAGNKNSNVSGEANSTADDLVAEAGTDGNRSQNQNKVEIMSLDELLNNTKQEDLYCTGFDLKKFTTPFYKSQIIYNEGMFLIKNAKGQLRDTSLYFKPLKILEVRSNDFQTLYTEGSDYTFDKNGKIAIPAGSKIRPMEYNTFFPPTKEGNDGWIYKKDGKDLFSIINKDTLYSAQIIITYVRAEEYNSYETIDKSAQLTTLTGKIKQNKDVNILFLGDSITAGAGLSSGDVKNYVQLTAEGIQSRTTGKVNLENCAVSGTTSLDYTFLIDNTPDKIHESQRQSMIDRFATAKQAAKTADVIFIAYGGNDAAGWMNGGLSAASYGSNVKKMIDFFRGINPNCSIVLVASFEANVHIYTNPNTKLVGGNLEQYANTLGAIETSKTYKNSKNLVYVDVYRMQQSLLKLKHEEDMIGDNRNHPSDYMTRIYAQTILGTILSNY